MFQANKKRVQMVSGLLAALLVKYQELQYAAQRAFLTYLRSIHIQKDKEIFDVLKLPVDDFSVSMGLPLTPKIRFLKKKSKQKSVSEKSLVEREISDKENELEIPIEERGDLDIPREELDIGDFKVGKVDRDFLAAEDAINKEGQEGHVGDSMYVSFLVSSNIDINPKEEIAIIMFSSPTKFIELGWKDINPEYLVFLHKPLCIYFLIYCALAIDSGHS